MNFEPRSEKWQVVIMDGGHSSTPRPYNDLESLVREWAYKRGDEQKELITRLDAGEILQISPNVFAMAVSMTNTFIEDNQCSGCPRCGR